MDPNFLNTHAFQHASQKPLGAIYDVAQAETPSHRGKPNGFWVDIDQSWFKDIASFGGIYDKEPLTYDVRLKQEAKILVLDGSKKKDVIDFCQRYGRAFCPDEKQPSKSLINGRWYDELSVGDRKTARDPDIYIDWSRVAKDWDGFILMSPYDVCKAKNDVLMRDRKGGLRDPYEKALDSLEDFDADSGCIWNKDAIESVNLAKAPEAKASETIENEALRPSTPRGWAPKGFVPV
jgi:hypothetical protein